MLLRLEKEEEGLMFRAALSRLDAILLAPRLEKEEEEEEDDDDDDDDCF
jgi:hypothetical protein